MKLALKLAAKTAQSVLRAARDQVDADRMLQRSMSAVIEIAEQRQEVSPAPNWRPGEPIKMFLAGYAGTRNTGADVRVEEMIRQFRHLFSDDHLNLSIFTLDLALTRGYFKAVQQIEIAQNFPPIFIQNHPRATRRHRLRRLHV